jgi:hypothetical protein
MLEDFIKFKNFQKLKNYKIKKKKLKVQNCLKNLKIS